MSAILKSTTILSDLWNYKRIILYGKYSNEWYAKDTSKKIKAVFRAKGMSGERISTNIPYGYLQDENKHLVVDEETAPVVRIIFQLCAEGNGPGKIARILREREIKTPRTMDFLRTGRTDGYDPDDPCGWASTTVASIGNTAQSGCAESKDVVE